MSERTPSKARSAVFALVITIGALWGINAVVEGLEGGGVVETHSPDDRVQFLDSDLFDVEDQGPQYVTSQYATDFMVPQRFPVNAEGRWRLFWTGGSFAMGTPFVWQGHGAEMPGGMPFWLRSEMERRWPDTPVDLVNLAAGGQNSHRVARVVETMSPLEPDAWFVATCNNEGALPPSRLREQLHKLGGYRLLNKYLRPDPETLERTYYTPQDDASLEVARAYRRNIQAMIQTTADAGIPLLLATLPINLEYEGRSLDQPIITELVGADNASPCITGVAELLEKGYTDKALAAVDECEDVVGRLQWRGLTLIELKRFDEGIASIEQSIELLPRNRCRPSYNDVVREEAAKADHVTLVDLDAAAREMSGNGVSGHELFRDYCHMHYMGYAAMADEVLRAMQEAGVTPPGAPRSVEPMDREVQARRAGLTQIIFDDR
jgi:hypothetical protein